MDQINFIDDKKEVQSRRSSHILTYLFICSVIIDHTKNGLNHTLLSKILHTNLLRKLTLIIQGQPNFCVLRSVSPHRFKNIRNVYIVYAWRARVRFPIDGRSRISLLLYSADLSGSLDQNFVSRWVRRYNN